MNVKSFGYLSLIVAILALALAHYSPQVDAATRSSAPKACVGCDLQGQDFHGRDLGVVSWVGADLQNANLRGAVMRHANLVGVDFDGADLRDADLSDSHMAGVDLSRAQLGGIHLGGAKMAGAELADQQFTGVSDGTLRDLLNVCVGCDLARASLSGRDLHDVHAIGVNFRNANLRGVNLRGAVLCWVSHNGIECDELRGTNLRGANLSGAQICQGDHLADCKPLSAQILRANGHADLSGAVGL
ncbi:MAG: pentapeptide repeat-containing protein [Candidatus Eremiobacteraeota bacterium]|nr:pentapeptide repeat-containing protein [Candidatus Eremiobacteraeota bacterium]